MITKLFASGAVVAGLMASAAAIAEPAVVFDMGGKFDKSFNEGIFNGVERYKEETGNDYRDFEVTAEAQREQALRRFARAGSDPIIAVGFAQGPALETVAQEFPDLRFAIIDMVVDLPNVQSIVFKEHEGSFLVGALAAMASETGKVGFVGGMDLPIIRRFACGYEQGARHVRRDTEVISSMTGTTAEAWSDPDRGAALARTQFDQGVDVVFAAAGATGLGVYQAAKDEGRLAIGVDTNQNHLHPGTMLTSMVKLVDVAVETTFRAASKGAWRAGRVTLGLAEGAVGWSLDEANRPLISAEMQRAVEAADQAIVDGEIQVVDYTVKGACDY